MTTKRDQAEIESILWKQKDLGGIEMATKSTAKTKTATKEIKQAPVNVLADTVKKAVTVDAKTKEAVTKKETVKKAPAAKDTVKDTTKDAVKGTAKTAVKETVKEATEKKAAAKKAPAKKAAAKKEIKIKTYVQYMGRQVEEKDMIAAVKKSWTKEYGKKVGDIKDIALYIKPEDGAVYYVVNGTDTGSVQY